MCNSRASVDKLCSDIQYKAVPYVVEIQRAISILLRGRIYSQNVFTARQKRMKQNLCRVKGDALSMAATRERLRKGGHNVL